MVCGTVFSHRSARDRTPNRLAIALQRKRELGQAVLDLTVSNPTRAELPYPTAAILRALSDPAALVYEPHPFGMGTAREAVAREMAADPARIVLTASTSEAYAFLFKLLCDPGDEVLVPEPSYPLLTMLAEYESVRLVPYRLGWDGEWYVDTGSLANARNERTRAVLTVNPNNPTGSYLKRDELDALLSLGVPIVSDEVFTRYPLSEDPRRVSSVLEAREGLVFALGGLSKLAALPQMKLGWIAIGGETGRVNEARARLELIADTFLSVGTPVQVAAPRLLQTARTVREAIASRARANVVRLSSRLGGSPASALPVEGGWYAVIRLPRTRTEEAWVLDLLEAGVLVQPGWFYDFAEEAFIVLSLLTPELRFAEGVERIAESVAQDA